MATVQDVLAVKGGTVQTISSDATVLEATQRMNEHKIGSIVVMQEDAVVGMFTERDVLRRIVVEQRDPSSTRVGEVMTSKVICCHPETDLEEISAMMKVHRVRHIPVVDDTGRMRGLISIGDINAYYASNQQMQIEYLSEYIYGRA